MDFSYTKSFNNIIDIPVNIEGNEWIVRLDQGFFSPVRPVYAGLHNHSFCEIHYIISGSCATYVKDRFYSVSANDICIFSPGVYHYHHVKSREQFKMQTVKIIVPPIKETETQPSLGNADVILKTIMQKSFCILKDTKESAQLLSQILMEFEEKSVGYKTNIQALFMQLFINLARMMAEPVSSVSETQERIPEEIRNEIIDGFFYHNYYLDVTSNDLARLINTSKRQLYRILIQLYKMSFKQKLLETRVEVAKELLANSNLSIQTIAEKVGYTFSGNFYSIFRQKTGMTPARFRALYRR
jgi:AraC-like DNA-binding protein/mannose-6-phosphate isomerase-like protein (cupin superfamily)